MRVIYVSTEVYPALKTGGLADVNAALSKALINLGVDLRLLLPAYPAILKASANGREIARLASPLCAPQVRILRATLDDVPVYLIEAGELYLKQGNPYVDTAGRDWPDNQQQFALLGWVAARFADGSIDNWQPDIVHGHDWHTGLAPAYLAARGGGRPGCVFTVHNLAFQGEFPASTFAGLALPANFFSLYGLEFYGKVNFMKAGLHYADRITTVSPTYAREILSPHFGSGMDGVLRSRAASLTGILNGVDPAIWNPQSDPWIASPYAAQNLLGKTQCKLALRRELGLASGSGAVFGLISRLTEQKGIDLVIDVLPYLIDQGGQLAVLGSGDSKLERALLAEVARFPGSVAVRVGYDETLAHRIVAGSDVILVPSRFEPCGLTQMYGLCYGALPLVRRVGGLADTVCDASADALASGTATGIQFDDASAQGLREALTRAFALWKQPRQWALVRHTAMLQDFSWEIAARQYLEVYRDLRPLAHSLH